MIPLHIKKSILLNFEEGRPVPDSYFDQVYPREIQKVSNTHWTPIETVKAALEYFQNSHSLNFLDVGSGCGKFCHAGALISPLHSFTGVEQREELSLVSEEVSKELELKNTTFINCNAFTLNWNNFDVLYFFNPFWENHLSPKMRIDEKVPIKKEAFDYFIKEAINKLQKMDCNKHIITYHGFGGKLPSSFECFYRKSVGTDQIEIWKKLSR